MKISEIQLKYKSEIINPIKISSSEEAYQAFRKFWDDDTLELREEMKVILLNRGNIALGISTVSVGGISATYVDKRHIIAMALKSNASGFILAHNHPSGNTKPSEQDKKLTKEIKMAGEMFDILLLDHLIITRDSYFSFADNGNLTQAD